MLREQALESVPIVNETLGALLAWSSTLGLEGANLRAAVAKVRVNALYLLQTDSIGQPLADCFELAEATSITIKRMENVRVVAAKQTATSAGAISIRNGLIQFCLVTQARILAATTFVSREDVEQVRQMFNASFTSIEEDVADSHDAMTYRAVVELHAAVSYFIVETARPLPRMLRYQFNLTLPTLTIAQKLYHDSSRADELRAENKIIHPAFSLLSGRALAN